jgi:hypothetical protein
VSEQAIIAELQAVNARLVALLASKAPAEPEQLPGLANEYAENMELVHIYRTQGIEVWRSEHRRVMADRKRRMKLPARRVA